MHTGITITTYCLQTPDSCRDIDRGKYKDFTFDHSYWSFDSNDENYASQEEVRVNILYHDKTKIIHVRLREAVDLENT